MAMTVIQSLLASVDDREDDALRARLQHLIDGKTKPLGSLGRLEALSVQLGLIWGTERPTPQAPQVVIFAGDHGLARQGVSAYPQEVTAQMVANFLAGGAAVNVLARQHGLAMTVVDAGVAVAQASAHPSLQVRTVAPGTADCSHGSAMTADQCAQAMAQGAELVQALPGNAVLFGEMGIGNTSSAALLMTRLTGLPLDECLGRGTGLDDQALQHKRQVLARALEANPGALAPLDVLQAFGGFEMAMMCGAILAAAAQNRVIVARLMRIAPAPAFQFRPVRFHQPQQRLIQRDPRQIGAAFHHRRLHHLRVRVDGLLHLLPYYVLAKRRYVVLYAPRNHQTVRAGTHKLHRIANGISPQTSIGAHD